MNDLDRRKQWISNRRDDVVLMGAMGFRSIMLELLEQEAAYQQERYRELVDMLRESDKHACRVAANVSPEIEEQYAIEAGEYLGRLDALLARLEHEQPKENGEITP
jgi:hypothetical protein